MVKDDRIFISHILESIKLIEQYTEKVSWEKFSYAWAIVDAVARRIEIIGEAANKISNEFKNKHQDIPWLDIVGMRNFLIHQYFDIDEKEVWRTVKEDLPSLKKKLKKLL
ncbi:MAG: DUF86 domain-containing protein [Patescibacteria group bacterium]